MAKLSHQFKIVEKGADDKDVWVNPEHVMSVEPDGLGDARIFYVNGEKITVRGLPRDVAAQLTKV
jgi:hypothetical protein